MVKSDRTVVRNQPYQRNGIGIRERHNERKNETYSNPDITPGRSALNVHFKRCVGTYEQALDKMLTDGLVSTRGLKPDAKVFEEMVFDVNTGYFDRHGGYEYAKSFFAEAFRFTEQEVGRQYILSAVMHADERNRSLSDELGRDVYHYHMHVVYLPVVEKEIKWSKRCKNPALVGTTKEVVHQISHSKKWAFPVARDEQGKPVVDNNGKPKRVTSYSLLQDRFFEHMRQAGYDDLERGIKGSTAEHLSVLDYKIQQDKQALDSLTGKITEQEQELGKIQRELVEVSPVITSVAELRAFGKKKRIGNKIELILEEYETLQRLAKEALASRPIIKRLHSEVSDLRGRNLQLADVLERLYEATADFRKAIKLAPKLVMELFSRIFETVKEEREQKKMLRRARGSGRDGR